MLDVHAARPIGGLLVSEHGVELYDEVLFLL
jgi:hypothetical protein